MRLALLLVLAVMGGPKVEVVTGGQYYHRPGHLVVDEPRSLSLEDARGDGFTACPECGADAYFQKLLAVRRAGQLYEGVRGRAKATAAAPAGTAAVMPVAPAASAPPPPPTFELPADGLPVPGTGGLLKVPTFKGSGGIIAIPYPMGGYTVVEPPFTGSGAPPGGGPGSSAR